MDDTALVQKIEAFLFVAGEALHTKKLSRLLGVPKKELEGALDALRDNLDGSGLTIMRHNETVMLVTAPNIAQETAAFVKEELKSNLSRAALETLAVVLYKSPIARPAIDYIRGVNSSYTLHTLLLRGLIERAPHPKDARSFLYKPSREFLQYVGITDVRNLPEYQTIREMKQTEIERAAEPLEEKTEPRSISVKPAQP